jgi:hypothetical protein
MSYDASLFTTSNKSLGIGQGVPTDARSYFYDNSGSFAPRVFSSKNEVLSYLSDPKNRIGHFTIYILENGIVEQYWFRDGTADNQLIKIPTTPQKQIVSIVSSATLSPNAQTDRAMIITALSQNITINSPGAGEQLQEFIFRIKDDGIAIRSITWDTIYRGSADCQLPTQTLLTANCYLKFYFNVETNYWDLVTLINNV